MSFALFALFLIYNTCSVSSLTTNFLLANDELVQSENPGDMFLKNNLRHVKEIKRKVAHYYPIIPKGVSNRKENATEQASEKDGGGYGSGSGHEMSKKKKIAIAIVLGIVLPLLGLLLIIPACLVFLIIGFHFPYLIVIDDPNPDDGGNNEFVLRRITRSIHNQKDYDEDACVEKVSCKIGKHTKTSTKILMHWALEHVSHHYYAQRIARGFFEHHDCDHFDCSVF